MIIGTALKTNNYALLSNQKFSIAYNLHEMPEQHAAFLEVAVPGQQLSAQLKCKNI